MDAEEDSIFNRVLEPISGLCRGYGAADLLTVGTDGWTDACHWIARRRALTAVTGNNELRLYTCHGYTDDVVIAVAGTNRMVRALKH